MDHSNHSIEIQQYSLSKILWVWAAAAMPMGLLGWVVAPALAPNPQKPGFERVAVLTVGLIWQFILVMILLYRETRSLSWSVLRQRLWLNAPRSRQTGESRKRLWLWLVPIVLLTAVYEILVSGIFVKLWVLMLPFLAEPSGLELGNLVGTPQAKSQFVGAWWALALFFLSAVFNTVLGEELLFRGLLLPRMGNVFGRWDWLANGALFGLYHIHMPWSILRNAIGGILFYALPSRYFQSAWFGIVAHSGESIFFTILILGLVLGLA